MIRLGCGRILTVPPLFREPEFVPVMVIARLLEGGEVFETTLGPDLPTPLKAALLPTAGGFHCATADGPASLGDLFIVHAPSILVGPQQLVGVVEFVADLEVSQRLWISFRA